MNMLELIKAFLTAYFVEYNPEKGIALVTEDIECYGFADDQELCGIEKLKKMTVISGSMISVKRLWPKTDAMLYCLPAMISPQKKNMSIFLKVW